MLRALVAIMLTMSATGCYQSVCADPICREMNPPDASTIFIDGGVPDIDTGTDSGPDLEEIDAAVEIPYPGCPDRPPLVPTNRFFWSGNTPGETRLGTIGMAGTCKRVVAGLSNFDTAITPSGHGRVDTVNLVTTGSSTSIMTGAYPEFYGRAIVSAPYGFALYADETAGDRHTLKTYDVYGQPLSGTVLIGGTGSVMSLAETLGNPLYVMLDHLHAGTNHLFTQEITHTTTPDFTTVQRHAFTMPAEFILGEVVRGGDWAALKVGYLEGNNAIGEIVFVSAAGERHLRFAERRFYESENSEHVLNELILQHSDIAPHRDGVLIATNRETGGVAYLLQADGTERLTVFMNGTGTAVTQLPYGFAAASYQGGQIHVTIRNTIEGTSQIVTINAPYEVLDSPRLSSAFYGYLIGVSTTFYDLPNMVSKTRFDTIASPP